MKKRASILACILILIFGGMALSGCTEEEWEWILDEIDRMMEEYEDTGHWDDDWHVGLNVDLGIDWDMDLERIIRDRFFDLPNLDGFISGLFPSRPDSEPAQILPPTPTPRPSDYILTPIPSYQTFIPAQLPNITNQTQAQAEINQIITNLTPEQRISGDALNIVTLSIETAARMGTTQHVPQGGSLSAALLQSGTSTATQIRHNTHGTLAFENMYLLRNLRTNINFISGETEELQIAFPEDVSGIPFDNVTIESEFASVTLNRDYIPVGSRINVRRAELDGPPASINGASDTDSDTSQDFRYNAGRFWSEVSDFSSPITFFRNFWFLLAIVLLIIIWLIVIAKGERLRRWVIPVFTLMAITINVTLIIRRIEPAPGPIILYADAVEVNMSDGMRATLSLYPNGSNPEYLVLINEEGQIQHSRYNPVTGYIDARIHGGGVYLLIENEVSFNDIDGRGYTMERAIRQLASRNIMLGAQEGYFYPDDPISRTDVVTGIIYAFDILDFNAQPTFTDISPHAWYYLAVATAQQIDLIEGFRDGTFRGNLDIPKAQLVVMSANTLMVEMGYHIPDNIETYLDFADRNVLRTWSLDGIALASASNVLIHRADGMFAPNSVMTRGEAAVVLYRVFSRVW